MKMKNGVAVAAGVQPHAPRPVGITRIAAGVTLGFKALPEAALPASYSSAQDEQEADWAGIYPQLSLAQAVAYLPNQFERGFDPAYIVRLTVEKPLVIVTYSDPQFLDGSVSSAVKAELMREALKWVHNSHHVDFPRPLRDDLPLMRACGEIEVVLCLPDAEGYELVVPKAMFTQEWLKSETLFTFHQSRTLPSMVGSVDELPGLHRSVLLDWDQLTQALETNTTETSCTEVMGARWLD